MDAVERKLIVEFMASNAILLVHAILKTFAHRLVTTGNKYGLVLSNNSIFTAATRQQVFEFLANVIKLSENRNVHATDGDQLLDIRTEPLQKLVEEMEALNLAVIPLVLVSLEADRRYCLKESIVVKVITRAGDISYMDLAGRSYLKLEQFLQLTALPFGILCYLEADCVLDVDNQRYAMKCKMVGRQLVFQSVADGLLSSFNVVGSLGLMVASSKWVTPIGLLTVGSSIYLMTRGVMGFFEVQRHGGLRSQRSTFFNILLTVLNFASVLFVSLPYSIGTMVQLNGPSKALLSFCAGMDLLWLLAKPPLHTYGWIDV
ncbi:uncharacterized protein LOC135711326 [Ochlerotatus camptorhynchus]|uniref:uncharacterized protein LOC135711326 n=1 Tax=Ochlerotatus camptorhynchus TaxID=644619 RepID=UPI0031DDA991